MEHDGDRGTVHPHRGKQLDVHVGVSEAAGGIGDRAGLVVQPGRDGGNLPRADPGVAEGRPQAR